MKPQHRSDANINSRPLALITGATAGIGEATARALAAANYNLVLTGRRKSRLDDLARELSAKYPAIKVLTLAFDVSDIKGAQAILKANSDEISKVDVLINNAGLAKGVEKFAEAKFEDWEVMIDTNVKGLLYMTRQILPFMIERKSGHIVNLGSVAGRWVYPGGSVYCATKFAVRAISESLRMDLLGQNIRVTNIEPGMVETEFSEVRFNDSVKAKKVYEGMEPLAAKDIAEAILWCLNRPGHVNIQELVIFPTAQAAIGQVHRK